MSCGARSPAPKRRVGSVRTEVVQPVVVRARDGGRELGLVAVRTGLLDRVEAEHEQPAAREQHRGVEPLGVHRLELRRCVPAALLRVGVRVVLVRPPADPGAVHGVRTRCAVRDRQHVVLDQHPHVPADLVEPDGRGVEESPGRCSAARGPAAPSRACRCRPSANRSRSSTTPPVSVCLPKPRAPTPGCRRTGSKGPHAQWPRGPLLT